jgi:hypothetical protein
MLFMNEFKLRVSMHSNDQVQFETNQANSMLFKLKVSMHSNYQVQFETNQANSMLSRLKVSMHSNYQVQFQNLPKSIHLWKHVAFYSYVKLKSNIRPND